MGQIFGLNGKRKIYYRKALHIQVVQMVNSLKKHDIMDVWFDSGSSHQAVLLEREELQRPADLYLRRL